MLLQRFKLSILCTLLGVFLLPLMALAKSEETMQTLPPVEGVYSNITRGNGETSITLCAGPTRAQTNYTVDFHFNLASYPKPDSIQYTYWMSVSNAYTVTNAGVDPIPAYNVGVQGSLSTIFPDGTSSTQTITPVSKSITLAADETKTDSVVTTEQQYIAQVAIANSITIHHSASGSSTHSETTGNVDFAVRTYAKVRGCTTLVYKRTIMLGDLVWLDLNGNQLADTNEQGIPGVLVTLHPSVGSDLATTTNAVGLYSFDNLIPSLIYTITVQAPANLTPNGPTSITKTPAQDDLSFDFPFWGNNTLGDRVWLDNNDDGIQGEPGLANINVRLLDPNANQLLATTTDSSGKYLFQHLTPGVYCPIIQIPIGYQAAQTGKGTLDTDSNADTGGKLGCKTFASINEKDLTYDAGLIKVVDLAITKSAESSDAFSITVYNNSAITTSAIVQDVLPTGFTFLSADGVQCTKSANDVSCQLPVLGPSASISFKLHTKNEANGWSVNVARVYSLDAQDTNPANNYANSYPLYQTRQQSSLSTYGQRTKYTTTTNPNAMRRCQYGNRKHTRTLVQC